MRPIDADTLNDAFTMMRFNDSGKVQHWGDRKNWCLYGSEIEKLIADAPTIEAEPVRRGRWIKMSDADGIFYACSECGEWHKETSNYCPNCGAQTEYVRKPLARALYQV